MQCIENNTSGPWAHKEYVAKAPTLTKLGAENRQTKIPGQVKYKENATKIDFFTEAAMKKKGMPATTAYTPELAWKPKSNFQKQTKTPKVTMTANILKKKK